MVALKFGWIAPVLFISFSLQAATGPDVGQMWKDLAAKRAALQSFHEEFQVARRLKSKAFDEASEASIIVDAANVRWRERYISGAGERAFIFDGTNEFEVEDGSNEYVRVK